MAIVDEIINSATAARYFGISRQSFYAFAERHGIRTKSAANKARLRQERDYLLEDVKRVYREIYGAELPDAPPQNSAAQSPDV